MIKHPLYNVWRGIVRRCLSKTHWAYPHYGGRGITICDRWKNSFMAFVGDIGPRPSLKHTVERINNGGHYEPGNCKWATWDEQANNRRTSFLVKIGGEVKTARQWDRLKGLSYGTVWHRVKNGWPESALLNPVYAAKTVYLDGERVSISEAARRKGLSRNTIQSRITRGCPVSDLFAPTKGRATP